MPGSDRFTFEISLSVLDHLGRNLYRSFTTVLGEAISNSWDADAENVWIYIDRENNNFVIKDDGHGMTKNDFQNKFLRIGYSKRKEGFTKSEEKERPFIGRKGIGKLALLSCSKTISVISKIEGGDYIGGTIDNSGLDEAIVHDLKPNEYSLGSIDYSVFENYILNHDRGTIIYFDNLKEGIRNSFSFLRKTIALYFRFSLKDDSFNIYLNDELITLDHLKALSERTEFLWTINDFQDPFIDEKLGNLKERKNYNIEGNIKGFIASVEKPRHLKVLGTDERVTIDLFVNGRLREKNILKHVPTARITENYLYGQIHFDDLDDELDRFTTSREGIVADDPVFAQFLTTFSKKILNKVIDIWDEWRRKYRKTGDEEDTSITPRERKSGELFNIVAEDYEPEEDSPEKEKVDGWINELGEDAAFNFASYADCFVSENLIRKYMKDQNIVITPRAETDVEDFKRKEARNKSAANISIDIREENDDLSYLVMHRLAIEVEGRPGGQTGLKGDADQYKPLRDALMHTALLTTGAKEKLKTVYQNIRGRVKTLLSGSD